MFEALIPLLSTLAVIVLFKASRSKTSFPVHFPTYNSLEPDAIHKNLSIPPSLWKAVKDDLFPAHSGKSNASESDIKGAVFRLADGSFVSLLVDKAGQVRGMIVGGQDGVREEYDFEASDIVALAAARKRKTGWLPWSYRWEFYDAVTGSRPNTSFDADASRRST